MLSRKIIWYDFDDFRLEVETRRLFKNGAPLTLPPKTVQALLILLENSGETVEKDEIYGRLWADSFVEEGNLTQHIYVLRKSLGQSPSGASYIETVARHGYRFTGQVKTVHAEILVKNDEPEKKTNRQILADESVSQNEKSDRLEQFKPSGGFSESNLTPNDDQPIGEGREFEKAIGSPPQEKPKFELRKLMPLAVTLLLVIAAVAGSYFYLANFPAKPAARVEKRKIDSIAVLPFKTIGTEESADRHLGLGMTDAIITRLSKLKQIPVRPTSAVFSLVGAPAAPEKIGRDLRVDAVLEGTVQRSGGWVRVSVRLIRVETGETLWAENFDGESAHIFKVQDNISAKVVDSLALNLTPLQEQNIKKRATENTEAYEAYVLGIYFWNKRTKDGLQKAERYFSRAIELDQAYAQAYAGLADTYNMLAFNRFATLAEVGEKAKAAALKAVELDETLAEAHLALAQVRFAYENNDEAGRKSLERAIELAPYNATARLRYGWRMLREFRLDAAEREMRLAQENDPLSPVHNLALCNALIYGRKYEEAAKFCERSLEIDRNVPGGRISLAEVYHLSGKNEQALSLVREERQAKPDDLYPQGLLAYLEARSGNLKEAVEIADRLRDEIEKIPILYADLALAYYAAGRRSEAFEILRKGLEAKAVSRLNLAYDPKFDEIKRDSRFTDLMTRYGLSLNPPVQ